MFSPANNNRSILMIFIALLELVASFQNKGNSPRSNLGSTADPVSLLPLLEAELATTNDMETRDTLRKQVADAKTAAEFSVRKVQYQFYEAFSKQDLDTIKNIWSKSEDVRCVHPGMPSMNGHEAVLASWAQILGGPESFTIEPVRTRIDISGQTALCSCIEEIPGSNGAPLECLNVYRREGGDWKMILHMASPIAMM